MKRFLCALLVVGLPLQAFAHSMYAPVGAAGDPALVAVQHNAYLMTSPGSTANTSTLHIINTSDAPQQFYGTLYRSDGTRLGEIETLLTSSSVPAYGRATLTSAEVETLFGETWSGPAMLEVYGSSNFTVMIRLRSFSGLISNTNCVTEEALHNIESPESSDRSFVRFFNTGTSEITNISGTMYDASGSTIGNSNQVLIESLGSKQQMFVNNDELSSLFGSSWTDLASLYVNDATNLKVLLVSFITEQNTFFNFSCFEGNDDVNNPVVAQTSEPTTQDITNSIFTARSADCADYQNTYFANVTDVKRSQNFQADITVSQDGSACSLVSDGIPNHNFNDGNASFADEVAENQRTFNITRNPQLASSSTALAHNYYNGVMLNGVVLDLLSAGCYSPNDPSADMDGNVAIGCDANDPYLQDPLGTTHKFGADSHNAHTQPDGTYHYHGNPNAMFDDNPGTNGSPVIGFAADGFPIYGSYFLDPDTSTVRKAVSGYTLKTGSRGTQSNTNPGGTYNGLYTSDYEFTNAGDLDTCNGMTVDGQYGYYVTDSYPWVMACVSGTVDNSFFK